MSIAAAASDAVQPSVTVRGEAVIRTEPDEAIVSISLSALTAAPGSALTDVAKRSEELVQMLDSLGIPREDRPTTGVTVTEEFDHTRGGRRSLGHRAAATVSVRLADAEVIGRVVMRASEELDARINGPWWRISADNPARLDAATQAAANAKAKATAYAAGVQARLGPLLALSEPEHVGGHGHGLAMPAVFRAAAGGPDMPIEPGEQEVIAAIEATFRLEPV